MRACVCAGREGVARIRRRVPHLVDPSPASSSRVRGNGARGRAASASPLALGAPPGALSLYVGRLVLTCETCPVSLHAELYRNPARDAASRRRPPPNLDAPIRRRRRYVRPGVGSPCGRAPRMACLLTAALSRVARRCLLSRWHHRGPTCWPPARSKLGSPRRRACCTSPTVHTTRHVTGRASSSTSRAPRKTTRRPARPTQAQAGTARSHIQGTRSAPASHYRPRRAICGAGSAPSWGSSVRGGGSALLPRAGLLQQRLQSPRLCCPFILRSGLCGRC